VDLAASLAFGLMSLAKQVEPVEEAKSVAIELQGGKWLWEHWRRSNLCYRFPI